MKDKVLVGAIVRDNSNSAYNFFNYMHEVYADKEEADFYFLNMVPSMDILSSLLQFKSASNKVYLAGCLAGISFAGENAACISSMLHSQCSDIIIEFARINGYGSVFILDQDVKTHVPLPGQLLQSNAMDSKGGYSYFDRNKDTFNSIIRVAIEGINSYCTIDYNNLNSIRFCSCFSESFLKEVETHRLGLKENIISSKIVLKFNVFDIIIYDMDESRGYALVSFRALNRSSGKGVSSDDIIRGKMLLCGSCSTWYIDKILINDITSYKENLPRHHPEAVSVKPNKLTLTMLVRNEADRYLPRVLEHASKYIDNAVILDDASEDDTVSLCRNMLCNVPLTIVSNPSTGFRNEISIRKQQWDLTTGTNPDWILNLDADEMFEYRAGAELRRLINNPYFDFYTFRLYDFWDDTHYREDKYWKAHNFTREFLVKFIPGYNYTWSEIPQHCGRFPNNIKYLMGLVSAARVKHFGWAKERDRIEKYKRYMELDPEGKYGILEQYKSILDTNPSLKKWEE